MPAPQASKKAMKVTAASIGCRTITRVSASEVPAAIVDSDVWSILAITAAGE